MRRIQVKNAPLTQLLVRFELLEPLGLRLNLIRKLLH